MNKRIQELSLLCYEEVGHYDMGSIQVFNHAKFAKMIVEDCLKILKVECEGDLDYAVWKLKNMYPEYKS